MPITYMSNPPRPLAAPDPVPLGIAGSWRLVFRDEFNGAANASPDTSKWIFWLDGQTRNNAVNHAANTFLDGSGNLSVRATTSDIGFGAVQTAGGLESIQQFSPGSYWEARLKGTGHSTFWGQTNGGMNGVPPDASLAAGGIEFDIFENISGITQQNVFYGGYGQGSSGQWGGHTISVSQSVYAVAGMHWDLAGGAMKFYVDGVLSQTFTTVVPTNTDQVCRLTMESDFGSANALASVDYIRIWVPG